MLKLASSILGGLLLLAGTVGCFMLAGHHPSILFYFVPLLAMLLIPTACAILAFGFNGPAVVLRSFAALWSSEYHAEPEARRIMSAFIGYVYGAGAFVFLVSLLSVLGCLAEVVASGLTQRFGQCVAGTIVALMYPIVLAELVLRPVKHRLA